MSKLFLLDAYALIYRSYYAFIKNPRINSKGFNTSAILGFVNTLHEVIQKEKPTHLGVAFDPHGKTFRDDAFPNYKAQREKTPEDIKASVPIIKDILSAMNIPVLMADGYEADDVIGTFATQAAKEGIDTYMLTPDKDYAQLVQNHVFMYRPRHGGGYDTLDVEAVKQKYSIENPKQVIDLLALMGDSADNFPGCAGVGEKTASKLIAEYGSVYNLIENTQTLKGKLKEKVENAIDDIKMSYFLATIKTDVPLPFNIDELLLTTPNEEKLKHLFNELEFKTLANKFFKEPTKEVKKAEIQLDIFQDFTNNNTETLKTGSYKALSDTPHTYYLIEKEEDMRKICERFVTNSFVSIDTETTSVNPLEAKLVGLSFSVAPKEAYYVPVPNNEEEAQRIVNIFKPLYENDKIEKIGQNIKYDIEVLRSYDVHVQGKLFDTMIAHYLLQPELKHNMDFMAETYLGYKTIHIDELIGAKGKNQKSMQSLAPNQVYEYACEDADITLQLKNLFAPQLKQENLLTLFEEVEMPLIYVLAEMEWNGIKLDTKMLAEVSKTFNDQLSVYEQKIYSLAGETFNISSPKQVGSILFDKLKIAEKPKKTKTGQYVTSEEELQKWANKSDIVAEILNYRGLKKLLSTYVDALPKLVNPTTGNIHTSFNQAITATGRLSSSDPNLQNIPVRGEDGKEIRKCFIPDEGCLFFSADYSQIELRIMAHLSKDPNMIEAFVNNQDIHAATAAKIYKKPINEVTKDERSKAKRANFGIIYGITTFGLAERLNIERSEAKRLIEGYFDTFPQVKAYMEQAKEMAKTQGYVETFMHRRRYLADINSANSIVRGYAERNAINAPIQGSAADVIKIAMTRIFKRFKAEQIKSKIILQVHDELNFSVYPDEKEQVERIVLEEMEKAYPLAVPLLADAGWGQNWLEAH